MSNLISTSALNEQLKRDGFFDGADKYYLSVEELVAEGIVPAFETGHATYWDALTADVVATTVKLEKRPKTKRAEQQTSQITEVHQKVDKILSILEGLGGA